jgi:hypothetical protein
MTKFYGDEEDPKPANGKPKARHYTMTELEKAYADSIRYATFLEEELKHALPRE